ncbi:hypothetical protein ACQJ2V_28000, partial [Klebsiella variicola subsp. variicola]|uniref:hypothetical protein n=1 Tax=Klebsiella variicola TaxID=244366 RepID=UPI003D007662
REGGKGKRKEKRRGEEGRGGRKKEEEGRRGGGRGRKQEGAKGEEGRNENIWGFGFVLASVLWCFEKVFPLGIFPS